MSLRGEPMQFPEARCSRRKPQRRPDDAASAAARVNDARQPLPRAKHSLCTPGLASGSAGTLCGPPEKVVGGKILLWEPPRALLAVQHALRAENIRCLSSTAPRQPKTSGCRPSTGAGHAPKHFAGGAQEPPNSQKLLLAKNKPDFPPGRRRGTKKSSCSGPAGGCKRFARLAGRERELCLWSTALFFRSTAATARQTVVVTSLHEVWHAGGSLRGFPRQNSGVPVAVGEPRTTEPPGSNLSC